MARREAQAYGACIGEPARMAWETWAFIGAIAVCIVIFAADLYWNRT